MPQPLPMLAGAASASRFMRRTNGVVDVSRFVDGWRVILVTAGFVMADQPLGGSHDLGRRAVVAGKRVDARAFVFRLEIENVPHIGSPEP